MRKICCFIISTFPFEFFTPQVLFGAMNALGVPKAKAKAKAKIMTKKIVF